MNQKIIPFSPRKTIPIKNALIGILLSIFVISGSAVLSYLYFEHWKQMRVYDPAYTLTSIELSGEALNPQVLCEWLDVSIDNPSNLYSYSLADGKQKLMNTHLFSHCKLKKKLPSTLVVNYTLRKPIAFSGDVEMGLVGADGTLFPWFDCFQTNDLPTVFFGMTINDWGISLPEKQTAIVLDIISFFKDSEKTLSSIDVSKAYADSYGSREIVVVVGTNDSRHFLRCSTKEYLQELGRYRELLTRLPELSEGATIDLRVPNLAFLKLFSHLNN